MGGHVKIPTLAVADDNAIVLKCAGAPVSGTSGTGAGTVAAPGSLLRDITHEVLYVNEGTLASPYWTPVGFHQRGLLAWESDFRDGVGKAVADTAASYTIPGSGLRVHGQGIAETDSGLTVAFGSGGAIASLITTDEVAHLAAISVGGATVPFVPTTHGPLVIDVDVAMSADILNRSLFVGFLGTIADALDPPVTSVTVTHTLVQDDLAGLVFDSALSAPSRLFAVHNKSDEAATLATTATGCDTGVNFPAAGTYQRLRVEISALGVMTCFADKVQIASIAAASAVAVGLAPCLLVRSTSTADKAMLVKHFATWGQRA